MSISHTCNKFFRINKVWHCEAKNATFFLHLCFFINNFVYFYQSFIIKLNHKFLEKVKLVMQFFLNSGCIHYFTVVYVNKTEINVNFNKKL